MSEISAVSEPNVVSGRCYFCGAVAAKNSHEIYNHVLCDSCNTKLMGILTEYTGKLGKAGYNFFMGTINAILTPKK
jgi:hypothetical protein